MSLLQLITFVLLVVVFWGGKEFILTYLTLLLHITHSENT